MAGGETDVQIEPGNPNVQVTQGQLDIVVKQAAANLSVEMPAPIIRIDQPAPEIIITMPNPDVVVGAAQPQVEVRQAEPTISVTQAAPKVDLDIRRAADGSAGTGIGISDNATGADYAAGASTEAQPVEDAVVSFNSADPKVTILEPENQSEVTIEKSEPRH